MIVRGSITVKILAFCMCTHHLGNNGEVFISWVRETEPEHVILIAICRLVNTYSPCHQT